MVPGDFNGDGLVDSMCFRPAGQPTLVTATGAGFTAQPLVESFTAVSKGVVVDFDGDGKDDIVVPFVAGDAKGRFLKSFGNGRFGDVTAATGLAQAVLAKADGTAALAVGNFSGAGRPEFLVMRSVPGSPEPNRHYIKVDAVPGDLLLNSTGTTGLVTSIGYSVLGRTARYRTDRGTSNAATYPASDRSPTLSLVTSVAVDSGVGSARNMTEFAYLGFKVDLLGRGALGFRENRRASAAPDGVSTLTQVRTRVQVHPFAGAEASQTTYLGGLGAVAAAQTGSLLKKVENTYCEQSATAGAENLATPAAPCATTAKVLRPYLRKSVSSAWDLDGSALPVSTGTDTYSGGYLTQSEVVIVGTGVAGPQTVTNRVVHEYWPDNTAADNWLLGLIKKTTTTRTVPNSLASTSVSAGSAPKATATAGP